ncbi:uncharacterized protein [Dysidea avara]|uniref:uncharacterized protein isoform X2 n=1 Tax=Dysidea avara TaxID=196820 RepID=UPI00332BAB52
MFTKGDWSCIIVPGMHWYRADDSGDTGKDLLQGRHLMTQLKEELRNETGIIKYPSLTLQWECVTEGTRSSKLEASYTVREEGEVRKQRTAVKVVITQGDTDKELEDKINLLQ